MIMYWRDASLNTLDCCIEGMHLSIQLVIVLEGSISQYNMIMYWRDASLNTLDCCIEGMPLSIHLTIVLEGCISQYI